MHSVNPLAPTGQEVVDYDRRQLALYAALLDADRAGTDWREALTSLMDIDPLEQGAEACWRSHLERARWITGEGLESAIQAFASATEDSNSGPNGRRSTNG